MTSNAKNWGKIALGLLVFAVGFSFLSVEMYQSVVLNENESAWWFAAHVGLTLGVMLIGGYIMAPALTEKIADGVLEHLSPILDRLPGGRRKGDPDPEPEVEPEPTPVLIKRIPDHNER